MHARCELSSVNSPAATGQGVFTHASLCVPKYFKGWANSRGNTSQAIPRGRFRALVCRSRKYIQLSVSGQPMQNAGTCTHKTSLHSNRHRTPTKLTKLTKPFTNHDTEHRLNSLNASFRVSEHTIHLCKIQRSRKLEFSEFSRFSVS